MLARVGLDEKHAPGDDTQAPDDNARLKARRRSVLFWWADCPRCTSASLCWGVESETAGGPARRRVGRSGEEGGLGESVPLSSESENLSPNSRPPPIVDPAAVTIVVTRDAVQPSVCSATGCEPTGHCSRNCAHLQPHACPAWVAGCASRASHVPSISPQNFRRESPRWRGSVQLGRPPGA